MKIFLLNLFSLEKDVLFFNNISLSENTLKSSPIEIKDEINNGIMPDLSNKNQDFFKNYLEQNIVFPNESSAKKKTMINQKKIFTTVYPKKISLFTKAKGEFVFTGLKEDKLIGNKRRRNKEDDIRQMIGRIFFNDIVINLINSKLKNAGCISLEQIFSKKDLLTI